MFKENKPAIIATSIFLGYSLFWILLQVFKPEGDFYYELFADTYFIMAACGMYFGFKISENWGGAKSYMGNSIFYFSFGLLAQVFGQVMYTIYALILKTDVPYPSLGDIGFFGSIFCYIFAVWLLSKASGIRFTFQSILKKAYVLLIPAAVLTLSYMVFLKGYAFEDQGLLAVFLDFGYPLGQALYISLALLTLILSTQTLGGYMRPRILFVLFALAIQYIADYTFLYQQQKDLWTPGGINDFIYLSAYFIMTMALLKLGDALLKLKTPKVQPETQNG